MKKTTLAACAGALLTLAVTSPSAQAQLMELPTGTSAGGLSAHQVRVLQLALRDHGCYQGTVTGRFSAATRSAVRCAQERSGKQGEELARELALWMPSDASMSRDLGGDVDDAAPATPSAPMTTPSTPSTPMSPPATPSEPMTPATPTTPPSMPPTPTTPPSMPPTPTTPPDSARQPMMPITPAPTAPTPPPDMPPVPTTPPDTARTTPPAGPPTPITPAPTSPTPPPSSPTTPPPPR